MKVVDEDSDNIERTNEFNNLFNRLKQTHRQHKMGV